MEKMNTKKPSIKKKSNVRTTGKITNSDSKEAAGVFDKIDIRLAVVTFLISLAVYILTLAPTVFFGDSSEFITGAYHLGIVHPPGYPLYLLLGKLFMLAVPFGDMAFRMNLMSAFFAALTVTLLFLTARTIKLSRVTACCSALLALGSSTLWSQAVVTEVYSLAAFFFMLVLFFTLRWFRTRERKDLLFLALAGGFALTHHITIVTFFPFIIIFILLHEAKILRDWKFIIKIAAIILLPLVLYAYLPLRSAADPPTDWGNPETISGMIKHVSAQQYKDKLLEHGTEGVQIQFGKFLSACGNQFTFFAIPLLLGGIFIMGRRKLRLMLFLTALCAVNVAYSLVYYIVDIENYFIPMFLISALFIVYFLNYLSERAYAWKLHVGKIVNGIMIIICLVPLAVNWREADRSGNYLARNYGLNLLKTVDQNGILFSQGDNESFLTAYLTLVEGVRPDVDVYDRTQNILPYPPVLKASKEGPVTITLAREWEREQIYSAKRPVYFNFKPDLSYPLVQCGLLYKVFRTGDKIKDYSYLWDEYDLSGLDDKLLHDDFMTRFVVGKYYEMRGRDLWARGEEKKAIADMEKSLDAGENEPPTLIAVGFFYMDIEEYDKAEKLLKRALKINPFCSDCFNGLGSMQFNRNEYEAALENFDRVLALSKDNQSALLNRAMVYEKLGDRGENKDYRTRMYRAAHNDLKKLRELNPFYEATENTIFRVLEKFKPVNDIVSKYEADLQTDPENIPLRYSYAVFLAKSDLYDKAIVQFKKVILKDPYHISSILDLGGAYLKTRKEPLALEQFRRALQLNPYSEKAKKGIALLRQAVRAGKLRLKIDTAQ